MFPSFDMPVKGNIMALLVLSAIFVLSVISFGFLISAALRSRNDCLKAALLVSAPALILSGYMWPIHSMPHYLQPIVYVIPLTVFLRGFLKIFQLGMGLTDIYREILFLLIQSSVYFTAGMLFLKRDFKEHKDVL
jgi:ABC-2 type transport system permease protein